MRSGPPTLRRRALRLACVLLAGGGLACASVAGRGGPPITPDTSLLAVDVRFPVPMGRDPDLVKVWLARGALEPDAATPPEIVQSSFVKGSRAYLANPDPGSWVLVAVVYAYAPPRNPGPVFGVRNTVVARGDVGHAIVLPAEWIERTRTRVGPGRVAFMGMLALREGERIDAETRFEDDLQGRLAEAVRPGSTQRSAVSARFSPTWTLDVQASSLQRADEERGAFLRDAALDLEGSTWADFVTAPVPLAPATPPVPDAVRHVPERDVDETPAPPPVRSATPDPEGATGSVPVPAPVEPRVEAASTPAPQPLAPSTPAPQPLAPSTPAPQPLAPSTPAPQPLAPSTPAPQPLAPSEPAPEPVRTSLPEIADVAESEPEVALAESEPAVEAALAEPDGIAPAPVAPTQVLAEPPPAPGPPGPAPPSRRLASRTGGPLDRIAGGMSPEQVREILGDPDQRDSYLTRRAWIPFYSGPGAQRRVWTYDDVGQVVFSLDTRTGILQVIDVRGIGEIR